MCHTCSHRAELCRWCRQCSSILKYAKFGPRYPKQALDFNEGQAVIEQGDFQRVVGIAPEDFSNNLSTIVQELKSEPISLDI